MGIKDTGISAAIALRTWRTGGLCNGPVGSLEVLLSDLGGPPVIVNYPENRPPAKSRGRSQAVGVFASSRIVGIDE